MRRRIRNAIALLRRRGWRVSRVDQIITATLAPAGTLYDGENAAGDLADLSTYTDTANYASTEGTIASVEYQRYTGEDWETISTDTVLSAGNQLRILVTDSAANTRAFTLPTVLAIAPAQFQTGDWSVADLGTGGALRVTLSAIPDDGGSALTAIEYQVDGGSWATSGLLDPGTFDITGLTDDVEVDIALRAVNAAGNGTASTTKAATPTSSTAATITSVSVGAYSAGAYPITIGATGQEDGDDLYWVIVPAADAAPSASEVAAGQASGGGSPSDSGSGAFPGPFSDTVVGGIERGSYVLYAVIDNGDLSNVGASDAFTVDTDAPTLTSPTASENTGDIDWSVTSDQAEGTIYAALYDSGDAEPSASDIINGTGDVIDTDSDASPAADGSNGGTFATPANATYKVAMVHVDDYGNVSAVVSSAEVTLGWTPLDLGAKLIAWYDLTDFANLYQTTDTSTPVTTAGQSVNRITDLSGNGNHLTTGVYASSGNGLALTGALDFNGAGFTTVTAPVSGLTSTMEAFALLDYDGWTNWCLLGYNNGDKFAGRAQNGNTGATEFGITGTIVHSVNNVDQSSPNRDQLFDAIAAETPYVRQRARGIDLSAVTQALSPLSVANTGIRYGGNVRQYVLTTALTSGEAASLDAWLASQA